MELETIRRLAMAEAVRRHANDEWSLPGWLPTTLLLIWFVLVFWDTYWP